MPFLEVNTPIDEYWASPLLQDVIRPLQTAGQLAATLASSPRQCHVVALLPLRADPDANANTDDSERMAGSWRPDEGHPRGKYVLGLK